MKKYSITATKEDYKNAYATLESLEKETNTSFNWKKIKRASLDELDTLIGILKRKLSQKLGIKVTTTHESIREDLAILEKQLPEKLDWEKINKASLEELKIIFSRVRDKVDEIMNKRLQAPITITKDRQIDIDNIRLKCVIVKEEQTYETYFQYIISSNSAHHSDIEFEDKMESIGVDIDQIIDDIENRKLSIN